MSLKSLFSDLKEIISLIEEQFNLEEDEENQEELNLIVEPLENNDNDKPLENNDNDEPLENNDEPEETEEELEIIRKLIELYVDDILKKVDKVIIKEMTKEQPEWREVVEDYLNLSKYKIKKFINDNNTKSSDEIVELLINL
jgi:hypothetical protein